MINGPMVGNAARHERPTFSVIFRQAHRQTTVVPSCPQQPVRASPANDHRLSGGSKLGRRLRYRLTDRREGSAQRAARRLYHARRIPGPLGLPGRAAINTVAPIVLPPVLLAPASGLRSRDTDWQSTLQSSGSTPAEQ